MQAKKRKKIQNELSELLAELGRLGKVLHGSWVVRYSTCSNRNCRCHQGEKHGPRHYLVVNENGRQRQKYVPNSRVEAVLAGIAEYKRALAVLDRISEINILLMKERALNDED
jgi:hypothetical protein